MPSILKWAVLSAAATTAILGVFLPALVVPQPAVGDALTPDGTPAPAVAQETCTGTDDVSIFIDSQWGLFDFDNGYVTFKDPPELSPQMTTFGIYLPGYQLIAVEMSTSRWNMTWVG